MFKNSSIFYWLLIISMLMVISSKGQSPIIKIETFKVISDSLFDIGEYEKADSIFFEAESLYRKKNNWKNWNKIVYYFRKRYQKNKDYKKAGELMKYFETLVPDSEIEIKSKLSYQIGYNHIKLLDYAQAIKRYKRTIKLFERIVEKPLNYNSYMYSMYTSISLYYSRIGDQRSALKYCDFIINYCLNNNLENKLCSQYINKGQFYFYDGKYKEAIEEFNNGIKYCNEGWDKAFLNTSLAEVFLMQQNFLEVEKKLNLASDFNSNNYYFVTIRSRFLFVKRNIPEWEESINSVIEILEERGDTRNLIKELAINANSYLELQKENKALEKAHEALCIFYPKLDGQNKLARPYEFNKIPYNYVVEALYVKAKIFRSRHSETNDSFSLGEATFYYDLLLSHFDKLKSEYYSSSSQYRMGAYSQKIYSEIITFYVDQFNKSKNIEDLESVFSLAQRANSFVLRNAVSDRKALELAGVQQDSLEEYLYLASQVASDANEDSTNSAKVLMEFDAYKESLLANYPSYGKYDREEEISLMELQERIDPNTLVVKYYYFDEVLTAIGISKDKVFAENIPFPKEMDSLVNSNLDILSQNEAGDSLAENYLANSKRIYDLVLGDLLSKYNFQLIDHLTIIPDGPLKKVSFNALAVNDSGDWNDPNSYLISRHAINYLYYCSQLLNERSYKSKDGYIGFGIEYEDEFLEEITSDYLTNFKQNVNDSRAISLSPLKYADDEVLTTAEILNGTSFINADVTPNQVYSTINNFDVIHFSAHAFVDEDEYLNSFVVLNKDNSENYQLKYSDILNLDLDSELVVLSACQTSSGKSVIGEGLMSLSRAFVQSGSNATVGAYWNAPDYATKELMTLFYSNLKEGMTKSRAMQQAQMEYLTNDNISSPTIRSPFFWASWAVYGNDQPLKMGKSIFDPKSWELYVLLAGLALIVVFLVRYFSKLKEN